MKEITDKDWKAYCNALNIDPKDDSYKQSDYYLRGFQKWQSLKQQFKYYHYMSQNV